MSARDHGGVGHAPALRLAPILSAYFVGVEAGE